MKPFLLNNDIEMYSIHNAGKSVITEKFLGALKSDSHLPNKFFLFASMITLQKR